VKRDGVEIGAVDRRDHHMDVVRAGALDERFEEVPPDALTPVVLTNVNRVLDGVAIARPFAGAAKAPVRREADHISAGVGDQDRIARCLLTCEPRPPLLQCL
jgi:hypothetical protein